MMVTAVLFILLVGVETDESAVKGIFKISFKIEQRNKTGKTPLQLAFEQYCMFTNYWI